MSKAARVIHASPATDPRTFTSSHPLGRDEEAMASPFDSTWQKYRAQAARGVSDKVEVLPRFQSGDSRQRHSKAQNQDAIHYDTTTV